MAGSTLHVTELEEGDLLFLFGLWRLPKVMAHADELPLFRGWAKSDTFDTAWAKYQGRRTQVGGCYVQLILRLEDGLPIGESFFAPLPEGFRLDKWVKPKGVQTLMGDIKLLPEYWNVGLGTKGMQAVTHWLFTHTDCSLLVVPPHGNNPAAIRVYEKAGFRHTDDTESWQGHRIMELWREGCKVDCR
jgi:RimJ/RimL family protein N-acetyltransferase